MFQCLHARHICCQPFPVDYYLPLDCDVIYVVMNVIAKQISINIISLLNTLKWNNDIDGETHLNSKNHNFTHFHIDKLRG